ncbi:right-handed parallel beta-helix repeat-containing protein [bacterium]|nr:right-handed parallel beta-helix repeat-containing protein [bacterium]
MKIIKCMFLLVILSAFSARSQSSYSDWLKRRDALKEDGSVMRYYTFEDVKDSKSVVKDLGKDGKDLTYLPYTDPETKEVFDDLKIVEGRWREKKAIRLNRGSFRGEAYNIGDNNQFTAEVWFKRQGIGDILLRSKRRNGTILSVSGYSQGWRIITAYEQPTTLIFEVGQPLGATSVSVKIPIADDVWQHLIVTFDGSQMNIYINGQLLETSMTMRNEKRQIVKADSFEGKYVATKTPFVIGYSAHGVGSTKLDIDEVIIYNRALKPEEIVVSRKDIFSKADTYLKQKDYSKARSEYLKMKGLPGYGTEMALFNIAETYMLEKDYSNAHKTFNEILNLDAIPDLYKVHTLFKQAELYIKQKNFANARKSLEKIQKIEEALNDHRFEARLKVGDTYKEEKLHSTARKIFADLLIQEEKLSHPNEGHRLKLRDRLEELEGVADGNNVKTRQEKLSERINLPKKMIYVSTKGADTNSGTEKSPFKTIKRAQEEVRKIKEKGLPTGGVKVILREGRYFLDEGLYFGKEDSGTEDSPIVYSSYLGEKVRLIGGQQVRDFKLVTDSEIKKVLPKEAVGKVFVADVKKTGIENYGQLSAMKGTGGSTPHGMELFFNGSPLRLARWPNQGHARTSGIAKKDGALQGRGPSQKGGFKYSDKRHERWVNEKDAWMCGFWYYVFSKDHIKIDSINTTEKVIQFSSLGGGDNSSIAINVPYYAYNLLSELDEPGEWYLDREKGLLFLYPTSPIQTSEVIVSTIDKPVISMKEASNILFSNISIEATQVNGVEIEGGRNNLIASSVIKNVGQWGVVVNNGWEHSIVGCDVYDVGAGGISLTGGDRVKLIPSCHLAENNHIYRFNRFDQGYRQGISIDGCGQRISHNLIHDSPMQGIYFNAMDHIIEYNELHDVVHEGRELGAMYIYGAHNGWRWMNRGSVIRNNFIHHISYQSSPNLSQGLNCIHLDGRNGGLVLENNIFYKFPNGISSSHPDMIHINNVFVDATRGGVSIGERGLNYFFSPEGEPILSRISGWAQKIKSVRYKQPPWNYRYPQLVSALMDNELMKSKNNVVERNISTGGPFINARVSQKENNISYNFDGGEPFFIDKEGMNFHIRPGSPAYALSGYMPVDMGEIGVYKDNLRASWPVNRSKEDIGKYLLEGWKAVSDLKTTEMAPTGRISEPLEYIIEKRKTDIKIDGRLDKNEWLGLDKKKAMIIENEYKGDKEKKGPKTYAWALYDKEYFYIAAIFEPDPYKEGMAPNLKKFTGDFFEVDIEGRHGTHSLSWWTDDMATGPLYVLVFNANGTLRVSNKFGMPYKDIKKLEETVEYKVSLLNEETREWAVEIKIPFANIWLNPDEIERTSFNLGTYKRSGFFAWVPTGTSFWRLENAGFVKFEK